MGSNGSVATPCSRLHVGVEREHGRVSEDSLLFTPEVVARVERQAASVPEHFRSTLWLHATRPQAATLRSWLERELRNLPDAVCTSFCSRLRDERRYTQALAELATGYVVRQPGYAVEFEPNLGGRTPDLLVTDPTGRQLIVEVWRRGLPSLLATRDTQWGLLARQLQRIPIPLALAVGTTSYEVVEPPDASQRRDLGAAIRRWLGSWPEGDTEVFRSQHFVFRVVGATTNGHVEMLPVRDGATADRKDVIEAIERKVRRYRTTAVAKDIPFVVVMSADDETAMSGSHVESILQGKNAMVINLPVFGVGAIDSGRIELRQSEAPPRLDPALSGIGWLDVNDGMHARVDLVWTNPDARWPIQPMTVESGER